MKKTIAQKAQGLAMKKGSIRILAADGRQFRAMVSGEHDIYTVRAVGESWGCTCPATKTCSHIKLAQRFWIPWGVN